MHILSPQPLTLVSVGVTLGRSLPILDGFWTGFDPDEV